MPKWTVDAIPDQTGRIAVVTGATSGLGLCCAHTLARRGAEVVLAVRNTARGEATAASIRAKVPGAKLSVSSLDLASLASVREFSARAGATLPRIDMLLNNAGLGMQPQRHETQDGFEQQFGTNPLGHFALTARLVPALLRAPAPRVVTVASMAHRRGAIAWDDLQSKRAYNGRLAYNQSKLANLMFALELAARAKEHGRPSRPGVDGISGGHRTARLYARGGCDRQQIAGPKCRGGFLAQHLCGYDAGCCQWRILGPGRHSGNPWAAGARASLATRHEPRGLAPPLGHFRGAYTDPLPHPAVNQS